MPILRLSPTLWAAFFRVMWLLGISRNAEPLEVAKHRAFQAARILVAYAKESNGPVLLMGHGVMNRLIAKNSYRWAGKSASDRVRITGTRVSTAYGKAAPGAAMVYLATRSNRH
jgi:hypothetical protein